MDGANGILGLVQVAGQLGSSVVKIKRIYDGLQRAPEIVERALLEVKALAVHTRQLQRVLQSSRLDQTNLSGVQVAIALCERSTRKIDGMCTSLETRFGRMTNVRSMKTVLREPDLAHLFTELERAKSSLILATQAFTTTQIYTDFDGVRCKDHAWLEAIQTSVDSSR